MDALLSADAPVDDKIENQRHVVEVGYNHNNWFYYVDAGVPLPTPPATTPMTSSSSPPVFVTSTVPAGSSNTCSPTATSMPMACLRIGFRCGLRRLRFLLLNQCLKPAAGALQEFGPAEPTARRRLSGSEPAPLARKNGVCQGVEYETDYEVGQDNVQVLGMDMHNPVFFISAVLILVFVIGTIIFPAEAKTALDGAKGWTIDNFDWLFMVGANIFVLFCIALIFLPVGKIRLGGKDARPDFSTLSWFAICSPPAWASA